MQNSVAFVREHGYGIFPDGFSSAELFPVRDELSRVELKRSRAGARHVLSLPSVSEIVHRHELLSLARGILGLDTIPFRATFFDKSPNSNWLVAWHQDTALPLTEKREIPGWGPWSTKDRVTYAHAPARALRQVLALRIHLDDSHENNGPLRLIPDSHHSGVLTDAEIHERAGDSSGVVCLVPAGGVIAMRPLIIHASSKSESELSRRVLHIEYASSRDIGDGLELALA